jgi:hypothetical protein
LGEKLHFQCHAILVQLYRHGRLDRQKQGRSFVYLASDLQIAANQLQAMVIKGLSANQHLLTLPVLALVKFTIAPKTSFEQLAKTIAKAKGTMVNLS